MNIRLGENRCVERATHGYWKRIMVGLVMAVISLFLVANSHGRDLASAVWKRGFAEGQASCGDSLKGGCQFVGHDHSRNMAVWPMASGGVRLRNSSDFRALRDPFAPLKNPNMVPKPQSSPRIPNPPQVQALPGKLLSVIHGPWGFQAVIQLSSNVHLVVQPGDVVGDSGWRVGNIQNDGVRLEIVGPGTHGQIVSVMLSF